MTNFMVGFFAATMLLGPWIIVLKDHCDRWERLYRKANSKNDHSDEP